MKNEEATMTSLSAEVLAQMKSVAKQAAANAYCCYSQFPVGAALLTVDGQMIPGCNVENISYGLTNCAERTAIYSATAQGINKQAMQAMLIYMPGNKLYSPCGACRQVIAEFLAADTPIYAACDDENQLQQWTVQSLLPAGFSFDGL
ncbi:cytidine deaminase [Spartinivicinus sp. A2-2]|uniref:Cytidine deaminase n=1 Tax=Spartinivicinus poritis TaxID=2994640 RepID=A0ABT5U5B7_9GAMM|nr:cytidine deaminase [Spartinivicinus sp. A2-2]MDE1461557.1 cytidine deaminase [Spartinivicinus sp. A2-2]